jgi:hypothetical protein
MDRSLNTGPERQRRVGASHALLAPVAWIAVLLAAWLLIAEWRMLPDLITATMAALR